MVDARFAGRCNPRAVFKLYRIERSAEFVAAGCDARVKRIDGRFKNGGVHAELCGHFVERVGFIHKAVLFAVLKGKAVGAPPRRIVDVFVFIAVCTFENVVKLFRLVENGKTDIVTAAAFVCKAFAFFIYKDDLIGAVCRTQRVFRNLTVLQITEVQKLNLFHVGKGGTRSGCHGYTVALRSGKAVRRSDFAQVAPFTGGVVLLYHFAVSAETAGRKDNAVFCGNRKLVSVSIGAYDAGNSVVFFNERFCRRFDHERNVVHFCDIVDVSRKKARAEFHNTRMRTLPQRACALRNLVGKAHTEAFDPF